METTKEYWKEPIQVNKAIWHVNKVKFIEEMNAEFIIQTESFKSKQDAVKFLEALTITWHE